jgi:hypothetical protein
MQFYKKLNTTHRDNEEMIKYLICASVHFQQMFRNHIIMYKRERKRSSPCSVSNVVACQSIYLTAEGLLKLLT